MPNLLQQDTSNNINKQGIEDRLYLGANRHGQLKIHNGIAGWSVRSARTTGTNSIGSAATLAIALTECCVELGRGKVYFVQKGVEAKRTFSRGWTEAHHKIPELLYVDHVWSQKTRDEWFRTPQWQRHQALHARANALDSRTLTMPIGLDCEWDAYSTLNTYETLSSISLSYNGSGFTYLGWVMDMAPSMVKVRGRGTTRSGYAQGLTTDLTAFQMRSGHDVVARLQAMWQEGRLDSFWIFESILKKLIGAYREWTDNGGYTLASDAFYSQTTTKVAEQRRIMDQVLASRTRPAAPAGVSTATGVVMTSTATANTAFTAGTAQVTTTTTGTINSTGIGATMSAGGKAGTLAKKATNSADVNGARLQRLRDDTAQWDPEDQNTLERCFEAANQAPYDLLDFTISDEGWARFDTEQKKIASEMLKLQMESDDRGGHDAIARAALQGMFPEGYVRIRTPSHGLQCAFHAICLSLEALAVHKPEVPVPTLDELNEVIQSDEWAARMDETEIGLQLMNTGNFHIDQAALAAQLWAERLHAFPLRLGYILDDSPPILLTYAPLYDGVIDRHPQIYFVYNDNAAARSPQDATVLNHFEGLRAVTNGE